MSILYRVRRRIEEKRSTLCIGLDPALPRQRERWTIPSRYVEIFHDDNDARVHFCLDIIDQTHDYAVAYKVNVHYVFGLTKNDHRRLVEYIHKHGAIAILDLKLNDIEDTVESAIFHVAECGYDMITFNPLLGNLCQVVKTAREVGRKVRGKEIGILTLVLTSNPDALKYQKNAKLNNEQLFIAFAREVVECDAEGCVVGATGHITEEDIRRIREIVGNERIILFPGIGAQKGEIEKIIRAGGKTVLINVGRGIIYSENPREETKKYYEYIKNYLKL